MLETRDGQAIPASVFNNSLSAECESRSDSGVVNLRPIVASKLLWWNSSRQFESNLRFARSGSRGGSSGVPAETKSNRDVSEGATAEKQSVLLLKSQLFQVSARLCALVLDWSILPTCKNFYRQGISKSNASAEMFCLEARGPCILISGKNQMNSICPESES